MQKVVADGRQIGVCVSDAPFPPPIRLSLLIPLYVQLFTLFDEQRFLSGEFSSIILLF